MAINKTINEKIKFAVAVLVFVIGTLLIVQEMGIGFSLPGFILVALSGPFMYYYFAKLKSKFIHLSDAEIIEQANNESEIVKEKL